MARKLLVAMNVAILFGLNACGGSNGPTPPPPPPAQGPTLVSVSVGGLPASLAPSQTLQLTATAGYSDNTSQNVTSTATWSSSNDSVATVAGGVLTARAVGSANITAAFGGRSDVKSVSVAAVVGPSLKADPGGPYDTMHNIPITLSGIRSTSTPNSIASFQWDCGQSVAMACQGSGPTQTVTYRKCGISGRPACQSGSTTIAIYTITLTITDTQGNTNTGTTTIQVRNSY